jgi:rhamnogalacturonan II specific xylosyltransferase
MFIRYNQRTMALMAAWHEALFRLTPGRDVNQYVFNEVLRDQFLSQLRVRVLPAEAFPSGALYFNQNWREELAGPPSVVHNNFIIGRERKLRRFKDLGLWLID